MTTLVDSFPGSPLRNSHDLQSQSQPQPQSQSRPQSRSRQPPSAQQPTDPSSQTPPSDPMELTSPSTLSNNAQTSQDSPDAQQGLNGGNEMGDGAAMPTQQHSGPTAIGAAQGPKVVQTAFIHKLYNMLEDRSIQHLISWSNTNESFVMSPSNEFSKVLSQYFKHTNISSFVRQLNMYGFHKVSDVFHTGSPDSTLWEFKHGNGNFRKGDLSGLREIKRRASRHALIHRDSFSGHKPSNSQPGTPAEPGIMDSTETRLMNLEHALYDVHNRLARTEDSYALLSSRCQALTEGLARCHHWTNSLTQFVQTGIPAESTLFSEISNMQKEIARQLELVQALEHPHEMLLSGRQPYFSGMSLDPPLSPRNFSFDESRRSSLATIEPPRQSFGRPPVPPIPPQFQFSPSPRRLGSISGPVASPGFNRPPVPVQPQSSHVHPLAATVTPPGPNLARRHTSADIREHWTAHNPNAGPNSNGSPFASGDSSVQWPPSSPHTTPHTGDRRLQEQLASYELNGSHRKAASVSQRFTPPPTHDPTPAGLGLANDTVSWSLGGSKFPRPSFELHSAPGTRRSSMASNVHSLLNPAETVERYEGEEFQTEERKRKRLQ